MKNLKIALINYEFYPDHGGVAQHLTSLCKMFLDNKVQLYIFNSRYDNRHIFKVLDQRKYFAKDLIKIFRKSKLLTLILAVKTLLKLSKIPLYDRFRMLIYIFVSPSFIITLINNLNVLVKKVKGMDIDLIFAGSTYTNLLPLTFIIAKILSKKIIALTHGNDYLTAPPLYLKTPYLANLEKLIVTSKRNKFLVKELHNLQEDYIKIIHLGLILDEYKINYSKNELRNKYNIPQDDFIIISVGRHDSRKRFDLVIKAISQILSEDPNINLKYYLIGYGEKTNQLKSLTRKLNLEKTIVFLTNCNDQKRNEYYKLSDIFIMPSITKKKSIEGFGIVYLEANYFKLPVIGGKSGGVLDAIIEGKTGFIIDPNDLDLLISRIKYLYKNREIRENMGIYGHKRVVNKFNWQKIRKDYFKLFQDIIENN